MVVAMVRAEDKELSWETFCGVPRPGGTWRRICISLFMLLFVDCASSSPGNNHMGENDMNQPDESSVPAIAIEAETCYVIGYPVLVSLILHNETADTDFLNLPELGLLLPIDSLAAVIQPIDGSPTVQLGPSFTFRDRDLFRTELMAGETKRMLIDLTQFGQSLSPGRYKLSLSIFNGPSVSRSSFPVEVEFIEPSPTERAEAERLRRLGLREKVVDSGSWQPFLTNNWNTVSILQAIGEKTSHQLALHLLLHRAAYGPEPLERFPLKLIREIRGPVLSAEAASLEYEILSVSENKNELRAARSRLLQTWPGLKARLHQIDNGQGLLAILRKGYGVEKAPPLPPGRRPYTLPGEENNY